MLAVALYFAFIIILAIAVVHQLLKSPDSGLEFYKMKNVLRWHGNLPRRLRLK